MMDYKLTLFCVVMNRAYKSLDDECAIWDIMNRLKLDSAKYPKISMELFEHLLQIYDDVLERAEFK